MILAGITPLIGVAMMGCMAIISLYMVLVYKFIGMLEYGNVGMMGKDK